MNRILKLKSLIFALFVMQPMFGMNFDLTTLPTTATSLFNQSLKVEVTNIAKSQNTKKLEYMPIDFRDKLQGLTPNYVLTLSGHTKAVTAAEFSLDNKFLISASFDKTIKVWDLEEQDKCIAILTDHTGEINSLSISPCGRYFASASNDSTIKIWDLYNQCECIDTLKLHGSEYVSYVTFSPCGKYLASFCKETNEVKIYDLNLKKVIFTIPNNSMEVNSICFSKCSKYLILGTNLNSIIIYTVKGNLHAPLLNRQGAKVPTSFLDISMSNDRLVSSSTDHTIHLWNLADKNKKIILNLFGHKNKISNAKFSPCERYLASADNDGKIKFWNLTTNLFNVNVITLNAHSDWINSIKFNNNGRYLVSTSFDKTIKIWDLWKILSNPSVVAETEKK